MLLLDTSAWVEYLRGTGSPADEYVAGLLRHDLDRVVLAPPVVMELLAGATPAGLRSLEALVSGIRTLDLDPWVDFHGAAAAHRAARAAGATVRSLVDCLVAVTAARAGATVVHRDRDFEVLRQVLPGLRTVPLA